MFQQTIPNLHYSPQKAQKSQKTNIKRVTALNYVIFRKIIFYFNSFIFNNIRGYSSNSWTGELIGLKVQFLLGFFYISLLLTGCEQSEKAVTITGQTMGTTYTIKIIGENGYPFTPNKIKNDIDSILVEVNRQMSTYLPESEISQFNRMKAGDDFTISNDFVRVVERALTISELTWGAFDITVKPILDIWGFGPSASQQNQSEEFPPPELIKQTLKSVGYTKLIVHETELRKIDPDVTLDLNAIAKGFGVDKISEFCTQKGYDRYLIEIGGEVCCMGLNENSVPWRIGIDIPQPGSLPGQQIGAVVPLLNQAMATSGDYRNFFQFGDQIYSHVIDPKTGYPVETNVASATVIAPTCMDADALATSLMVLGEEKGLALIESMDDVETLLIIREGKDQFRTVKSSGMRILE